MKDYSTQSYSQYLKRLSNFKGYNPLKYQEKAYVDTMTFINNSKKKSGLIVMPTGAGKSLLCSWLSLSLHQDGKGVLMLVPSIELLHQNKEKIEEMGGGVGIFSGTIKETDKPLTIATIQSLNENAKELIKFKYIIVDEAHFKYPYEKGGLLYEFVKKAKPNKIIGMTATPFRLVSNQMYTTMRVITRMRGTFFKDIIHITQVKDVIESDMWAKINYKIMPFIRDGLVLNTTGNSFTEESIQKSLEANNTNNQCCSVAKKIFNKEKTKTLIYVSSIEVANIMRNYLNKNCDRRVEVVTSETKKKHREEIINTFKTTYDIAGIINVGTLIRGFDDKKVTHGIIARPTNSLNTYYQMIGRLVRKCNEKQSATIIDLCGNIDYFGKIEDFTFEKLKVLGLNMHNKTHLLTNVNMKLKTRVPLEKAVSLRTPKRIKSPIKMPFGKYKGKLVIKLPKFYREWLLDNIETSSYMNKDAEKILPLLKQLKERDESSLVLI